MNIKLGAHKSSSGGGEKALQRVKDIGGNCLQLFSGSPRTWKLPEVSDKEVKKFKDKKEELGIDPIYFHASYLINLGDDGKTGHLSKRALKAEFEVADKLGVIGSVVHVGTFKDRSMEPAYEHERYDLLIDNIKEVLDETPDNVLFMIENMGVKKIGKRIDEIARIIEDVDSDRMRVCLDTCHLHAAGIDISSEEKLNNFLDDFDDQIGLEKLELWHLNDSRDEEGSFRDRHANIGEGEIGKETFEVILNNSKINSSAFIIETPGFGDSGPDKKNLDILKDLIN